MVASENILMNNQNPPVVIGGSGGSGTRVLASLLMISGYYMGVHQNVSCDALEFVGFYDRWLNPYNFGRTEMDTPDARVMRDEFNLLLTCFKRGVRSDHQPWGWKNPRSMLMLPFLNSVFTDMKFIHLVRDGRDMLWSKNKNQLEKHAELILTGSQYEPPEIRSMHFWSESNMLVAAYGEQLMTERYIRIRFEDLCFNTEEALCGIGAFLGRPVNQKAFASVLHTPGSVGRWKGQQGSGQDDIFGSGEKALRYFNYLD